jgi:hypothetical protein
MTVIIVGRRENPPFYPALVRAPDNPLDIASAYATPPRARHALPTVRYAAGPMVRQDAGECPRRHEGDPFRPCRIHRTADFVPEHNNWPTAETAEQLQKPKNRLKSLFIKEN